VTKEDLGHTRGTLGHRLWGHRRLGLCRVLLARLVLIVTEVANLPLDADKMCKTGVVSTALSATDHRAPEWVQGLQNLGLA